MADSFVADSFEAKFSDWLLVSKHWVPETVDARLRDFRRMRREGLDVQHFTLEAGRAYLARRIRAGASSDAQSDDVRVLNALAEYHGLGKRHFERPRKRRSQPNSLRPEQQGRALLVHDADRDRQRIARGLVHLVLAVGPRRSEAYRMDLDDVVAQDATVAIRAPAKRGLRRVLPVEPWLFHPRRQFMAYDRWRRELRMLLEEYARLGSRPETADESMRPGDEDAYWLSWDPRARQWRRASMHYLSGLLRQAGRHAGTRFNFNTGRHTVARALRRAGRQQGYVQFWLGHAHIASVEPYFEEIYPDEAAEATLRWPRPDPGKRRTTRWCRK